MGKLKKVGSIEIDEDMDFQRASWKVQRAGWVLMLLFIITGLLGLFGNGPISSARAGDEASTLLVEYDRFLRVHAPTAAMFRIGNDAALPDSTVRLWVDRSWVSAFELRAITPEPDRAETSGTRLVYVFRVMPPVSELRITMDLEARKTGRINGVVGLTNGPAISISQFAYP